MTYLLYVKVNSWSDWTYYGMVSDSETAIKKVRSLKRNFNDAKYTPKG